MNSIYLQGKFLKAIGPVSFEFLVCDGEKKNVQIIPSHVEFVHIGFDYLMFLLYREEGEDTFYQIVETIPCEWNSDNYLTKFKGFPKSIHPFQEDYNELLGVHEQIKHWARYKNPGKHALELCESNKPFKLHEVKKTDISQEDWLKLYLVESLKYRMIQLVKPFLLVQDFADLRSVALQDVFVKMIDSGVLEYERNERKEVKSISFKWLNELKIEYPVLLDDVMITGKKQDVLPIPDMADICYYVKGRITMMASLNKIGANLNVLFVTNFETDTFPDLYYTRTDQRGVRMVPMKCTKDMSPAIRNGSIVSICIEGSSQETIDVWYDERPRQKTSVSLDKKTLYEHFEFAHCLKPSGLLKQVGVGYDAIVCLGDSKMLKRRAFYVEQKQRTYRKGEKTPVFVVTGPLYYQKE